MSTLDADNERLIAMLCHASSLLWLPLLLVGVPIPFANVVLPLVVWFTYREKSLLIDRHGRESLNFQISMLLYSLGLLIVGVLLALLIFVVLGASGQLESTTALLSGIGLVVSYGSFVLLWSLIQSVLVIWASVRAQQGRNFQYPCTIRLLGAPQRTVLEQPMPQGQDELKADPFEFPPHDI